MFLIVIYTVVIEQCVKIRGPLVIFTRKKHGGIYGLFDNGLDSQVVCVCNMQHVYADIGSREHLTVITIRKTKEERENRRNGEKL